MGHVFTNFMLSFFNDLMTAIDNKREVYMPRQSLHFLLFALSTIYCLTRPWKRIEFCSLNWCPEYMYLTYDWSDQQYIQCLLFHFWMHSIYFLMNDIFQIDSFLFIVHSKWGVQWEMIMVYASSIGLVFFFCHMVIFIVRLWLPYE